MKRAVLITTAIIILLACSCGISPAQQEISREMFAMDTLISVKAYGNNANDAVRSACDRLSELERKLSVTDENSEIFRLNSHITDSVSDETADIISAALGYCEASGGALDITIYPVLRKWGFTAGEYRVPTDDEIAAALGNTGYKNVAVSGNKVTLPEGYMLDLGSCAKGYASDEMKKSLEVSGVGSAIINLGGNVTALGKKPDGNDWTVGISDPFQPSELLGTVRVNNRSVVTSGGYQRYFIGDDGKKYIHIIDPSTGRPAESGLMSVTVIGGSGLMCDALSTALFVMGKDRAIDYWRLHGGFDMILVTDDKEIIITEGAAEVFENASGMSAKTIYEQ